MHQIKRIKQIKLPIFLLLFLSAFTFRLSAMGGGFLHSSDTLVHGAPQKVADSFSFTEGPASDTQGDVYFTDQPNNRIWKYTASGKLSLFMEPSGRSNGMYFDHEGNLVSCADEKDELWSISPDKKVKVLVKNYNGARLNGPNDVWVAPNGNIYITDPYYQRKYWKRQAPDPAIRGQYVYYLPKGDSVLHLADTTLQKPNGIIGSPDGKYLYIADIGAGRTYRFDIGGDGSLNHKTLFVKQGSDGLTIDREGNLYLTGKGITVYDPQGNKIGHIPIPEPWTSNVCFFGKKRDRLFVTASTAVYVVQMKTRGLK